MIDRVYRRGLSGCTGYFVPAGATLTDILLNCISDNLCLLLSNLLKNASKVGDR